VAQEKREGMRRWKEDKTQILRYSEMHHGNGENKIKDEVERS
jgi:hypothetical protein